MTFRAVTLLNGEKLWQGGYIDSGNGYYLVLQRDANLVLYKTKNFKPHNAVWSSQTDGQTINQVHLVMQADNNLVLYDGHSALWSSQTHQKGTRGSAYCILQKDGNFVMYDGNTGVALWSTQTHDK